MRASASTSAIAAMLTLFAGADAAVADTRIITCESTAGQQRFCPTDTRRGVSLSNQLSRTGCREGSTWWYDSRGIYVSNGCRAQFAVGSSSRDHTQNRSHHDGQGSDNDGAAAVAALALLAAGAAAVHHEHEKDRRERQSEQDRYYNYQPPPQNPYAYEYHGSPHVQNLRCESDRGDYRYCNADIRRSHVEIERQISKTSCRFGQNWGYDPRGIWVDGGCRAEFAIYP
ncbi:MAG TPA: DUF3011 domain-containing protein [Steroidobacteraceae bacterium]|nr:DUF3011 domain-containing protein [Steroidobacteraceae bacterium]